MARFAFYGDRLWPGREESCPSGFADVGKLTRKSPLKNLR